MPTFEDHEYFNKFENELWHDLQKKKRSILGDLEKRLPEKLKYPSDNIQYHTRSRHDTDYDRSALVEEQDQTLWTEDLSFFESGTNDSTHDGGTHIKSDSSEKSSQMYHQTERFNKEKEDMAKTIILLRKENANLMGQIREERDLKATPQTTSFSLQHDELDQLRKQLDTLQGSLKDLKLIQEVTLKENDELKKKLKEERRGSLMRNDEGQRDYPLQKNPYTKQFQKDQKTIFNKVVTGEPSSKTRLDDRIELSYENVLRNRKFGTSSYQPTNVNIQEESHSSKSHDTNQCKVCKILTQTRQVNENPIDKSRKSYNSLLMLLEEEFGRLSFQCEELKKALSDPVSHENSKWKDLVQNSLNDNLVQLEKKTKQLNILRNLRKSGELNHCSANSAQQHSHTFVPS